MKSSVYSELDLLDISKNMGHGFICDFGSFVYNFE